MKDIQNNKVEEQKWYKLMDGDTNIYDYHRFINIVEKLEDKKYFCLEMWRNSNNPELSPSIDVLPEEMLDGRLLLAEKSDWKEKVNNSFGKLKREYISRIFIMRFKKRS